MIDQDNFINAMQSVLDLAKDNAIELFNQSHYKGADRKIAIYEEEIKDIESMSAFIKLYDEYLKVKLNKELN